MVRQPGSTGAAKPAGWVGGMQAIPMAGELLEVPSARKGYKISDSCYTAFTLCMWARDARPVNSQAGMHAGRNCCRPTASSSRAGTSGARGATAKSLKLWSHHTRAQLQSTTRSPPQFGMQCCWRLQAACRAAPHAATVAGCHKPRSKTARCRTAGWPLPTCGRSMCPSLCLLSQSIICAHYRGTRR